VSMVGEAVDLRCCRRPGAVDAGLSAVAYCWLPASRAVVSAVACWLLTVLLRLPPTGSLLFEKLECRSVRLLSAWLRLLGGVRHGEREAAADVAAYSWVFGGASRWLQPLGRRWVAAALVSSLLAAAARRCI
jgi:hypothetical protein